MYQSQKVGYEQTLQQNKVRQVASNLASLTHRFRDEVKAKLANGSYVPLVDEGVQNCMRALPWWNVKSQV
jgi:hypothetical protein